MSKFGTPASVTPEWLRHILRFLVVGIAAVHTTVAVMQQSMNEDGIDYLDVGAAYWQGDWDSAINGIWSPLYSWILGTVIYLSDPSVWWEFPVVQITNLFIFGITLICFEFFWRTLTDYYYGTLPTTNDAVRFPPAIWLVLGYSLFTYASLNLIEIWSVTPDMCVSAIVYLAAGLFVRVATQRANSRTPLLLGLVLGTGYLAKAAMLPLAIACALVMLLLEGSAINRAKRSAWSLLACMLVASPFVTALSLNYGEFMFTGVSKFTYLKHVNDMRYPNFIPDVERLGGTPEHPPTRVFDDPPVYAFAEPVGGTYPMSYDPAYWTAGLSPNVDVVSQLRTLATSGIFWFDLFVRGQGGFLAILLVLVLLSIRPQIRFNTVPPEILLSLWAVAAFGMYSLVHLTPRYIAPFLILFWAGILTSVRLPATAVSRSIASIGGSVLALFVCLNIMAFNLEGLAGIAGFKPAAESAVTGGQFSDGHSVNHPELATLIFEQGLRRHDRIGFIGYSFTAYWARLARLKIVAEIHSEDVGRFWAASPEHQTQALRAFYKTGAIAVIAEPVTYRTPPHGWSELGNTGYLIHLVETTDRY